jgi:hypothetical protein
LEVTGAPCFGLSSWDPRGSQPSKPGPRASLDTEEEANVKRTKLQTGVAMLAALGLVSAPLWTVRPARAEGSSAADSAAPAKDDASELKPAPGRNVVTLNAEPGRFNEPSIALNRLNPHQLVASFQRQVSVAYSGDDGKSWYLPPGIAPTDYPYSSDSSITYDIKGHAILCHLGFGQVSTYNYLGHNPQNNGIYVRRSLDGGKTWEPNRVTVAEQKGSANLFEDKPYIVADNQPTSPFAGYLYVGWTRNSLTNSMMVLSRSTDGGATWSEARQLGDKVGLPRDDNGIVEGYSGVVTPDGALHSVWSGPTGIVYTVSRDGGRTFAPSRELAEAGASHFTVFGIGHANGYPRIDMAAVKGHRARLYVTWSDYRNGDVDVFVISSPDGGRTWSRPARVNSDPLHNGADQLFSWLAVDPTSGDVYIMFYDRRSDPGNRKVDVVLARSRDGGKTFENFLFSDHSFDPMETTIGDYTALVAYDGRVYGIWTDVVGTTELPNPSPTAAKRRATVMRVGMADFRVSMPDKGH